MKDLNWRVVLVASAAILLALWLLRAILGIGDASKIKPTGNDLEVGKYEVTKYEQRQILYKGEFVAWDGFSEQTIEQVLNQNPAPVVIGDGVWVFFETPVEGLCEPTMLLRVFYTNGDKLSVCDFWSYDNMPDFAMNFQNIRVSFSDGCVFVYRNGENVLVTNFGFAAPGSTDVKYPHMAEDKNLK